MVLPLMTKLIGYEQTIGHAWMIVEHPEDHPQFKRKVPPLPFEKERELSPIDEDLRLAFEEASIYIENNNIERTCAFLYDTMIK